MDTRTFSREEWDMEEGKQEADITVSKEIKDRVQKTHCHSVTGAEGCLPHGRAGASRVQIAPLSYRPDGAKGRTVQCSAHHAFPSPLSNPTGNPWSFESFFLEDSRCGLYCAS